MGLRDRIARYNAIVKSVRRNSHGYWVVTYSCAPGVDMPVILCDTGITADQARVLASHTLLTMTGQKVSP
jgi:hypothetical protein